MEKSKEEIIFAKSMTMLAAYLELVHLQAEAVIAQKLHVKPQTKQRVRHISNFASSSMGTLCTLGNMSKEGIIDLAGEIDDILRPNIIEDNDNKTN
jgi:hypothetical protein